MQITNLYYILLNKTQFYLLFWYVQSKYMCRSSEKFRASSLSVCSAERDPHEIVAILSSEEKLLDGGRRISH